MLEICRIKVEKSKNQPQYQPENSCEDANKSKKVLGVCFSFDDVDKEKELFYVFDERYHVQKHYKFSDFVKLLFGEYKDVHFSLSSNAMSMLAAQEYPFRKSKNDRVCIM